MKNKINRIFKLLLIIPCKYLDEITMHANKEYNEMCIEFIMKFVILS